MRRFLVVALLGVLCVACGGSGGAHTCGPLVDVADATTWGGETREGSYAADKSGFPPVERTVEGQGPCSARTLSFFKGVAPEVAWAAGSAAGARRGLGAPSLASTRRTGR